MSNKLSAEQIEDFRDGSCFCYFVRKSEGKCYVCRVSDLALAGLESARLRDALEYIATGGENWKDCCRKARAALKGTP